MITNSFGTATNNASAVINEVCNSIMLYVRPKYLHLPKTSQEIKEKISEFETKFGLIQAFGCIDGSHISSPYVYHSLKLLHHTLAITSVTNNPIQLAYKLYAIIKVFLWMQNVSGVVVFTRQKYL